MMSKYFKNVLVNLRTDIGVIQSPRLHYIKSNNTIDIEQFLFIYLF